MGKTPSKSGKHSHKGAQKEPSKHWKYGKSSGNPKKITATK